MIAYEYEGFLIYSNDEDYFKIVCKEECKDTTDIERITFENEKEAEEFIDEYKKRKIESYPEQTTMKLVQTKYKSYKGSMYVLKMSNSYANKTKVMSTDLYDPNTIVFFDKKAAEKSARFRTGNWIVVKINKI